MTASKDDDNSIPSLSDIVSTVGDIASAYLSNPSTRVEPAELEKVIGNIYKSVAGFLPSTAVGESTRSVNGSNGGGQMPAVPIKKSITPDYLICLEDGKHLKTLKRHLEHKFNLTPAQYREKWGLPLDYPMVAPNYSKERSRLAREMKLGTVVKSSLSQVNG